MAGRERGDEEILRIVDVAVSAKHRVGTAGKLRFSIDLETILATVARVGRCPSTEIAIPDETSPVIVCVLPSGGCGHFANLRGGLLSTESGKREAGNG